MHDEAEHLEHHISEDFEQRIDALLGYPTHDPHGHPIPTQDLRLVRAKTITLSEAPVDEALVIHHVSDNDAALLNVLERIGLMPGCRVRIVVRSKDGMKIQIGGREEYVEEVVTRSVHVMA